MTSLRNILAAALLLAAADALVLPVLAAPAQAVPGALEKDAAWPMHPIADRFRGANSLGPGDVNQDGLRDYVTNYEFDQRLVIALHPGPGANVMKMWPTVTAWMPRTLKNGNGVNPEHSALGDFDGDGNLDVVAAQGWSRLTFWEGGGDPGIRIVWGPPPSRVRDEGAWSDGGVIPATASRGHLIYVVPFDVNGDGALDIVSGGRVRGDDHSRGGVIWIEAPKNPDERRDLSRWSVHAIDPDQFSAHGLVLTDIDADGDADIALANADFDTPEDEEKILWYENPGPGSPRQKDPWPIHVIYQGGEFHGKPQIAVADLDGDGLVDLLTSTDRDVYWFKKTGLAPVSWQKIVIRKGPAAQWPSRPLKVADLDGDGRPDIVGMLVHEDGALPPDKAAAFWMEYEGDAPGADNWKTHVIKWGSGRTMLLPIFGEKWDQMDIIDVDGDGDLDLVANCEEWWEDDIEFRFFWDRRVDPQSVAVVWFENRMREPPYLGRETGGACVIEAEHYTTLDDGSWYIRGRYPGYEGDGYIQAHERRRTHNWKWEETRGLTYRLELQGGSYYIWLRRLVPGKWGDLGRSESNSCRIGIDGRSLGIFDNGRVTRDQWGWVRARDPVALSAGSHELGLRIREGGYAVDRILVTRDPGYSPAGPGPAETARPSSVPAGAIGGGGGEEPSPLTPPRR